MTDEMLVREILCDKAATPREKELARRMNRLLHTLDDYEETLEELAGESTFIERALLQ